VNLSTGGHWRNRQDTGGHEVRRVRDREAPGSNPGPPTSFSSYHHCWPPSSSGNFACHNFLPTLVTSSQQLGWSINSSCGWYCV
jgi:hypothetical protein